MSNNILLCDVIESDLPIFFEYQLNPDATEMAAFPSKDRDAFMAQWARIMSDESVILETILSDARVLALIILGSIARVDQLPDRFIL
ncbi:MAG TPA: hypothetical protein VFO91_05535 [Anaerolineales bacterium]|nr:hypothetical protein [Anaerolineales bacterium]